MKRVSSIMLGLLFLFLFSSSTSLVAQKKDVMPAKMKTGTMKMMPWTTSSKAAREWTQKGTMHFLNAEWAQAYDYFNRAASLDPNFTEPLVFLSWLSYGKTQKDLAQRAQKSAASKPDAEKLLVAMVGETAPTVESQRETWTKLHEQYPDDAFVWGGYVRSRATLDERIAAAEEFIGKFPNQAFMYNQLGYMYLEKKDNETAKKHFEKYIELYPDGYNPYDSMGEYYLTIGDMENAEKYYTMALEKYPFNASSREAMQKIKAEKKKSAPADEKQ